MGLAVQVGMLADLMENDEEGAEWVRKSLAKVNEVLRENGLDEHKEPEKLPRLKSRAGVVGYPYSCLHYLRRIAAKATRNPKWKATPCPESEDPSEDPAIFDEMAMLSSHLLCHSDCEGFYVPIEFDEPLFADESQIPGGMLGSSQGLMRELVVVAPFLGIELSAAELTDKEAERLNGIVAKDGPFSTELMVWISLFEAARLSLQHRTAISFA